MGVGVLVAVADPVAVGVAEALDVGVAVDDTEPVGVAEALAEAEAVDVAQLAAELPVIAASEPVVTRTPTSRRPPLSTAPAAEAAFHRPNRMNPPA